MGSLAIHRPLKVTLDSFSFGGTRISVLGLAVALMCSGCMSTTIKPSIDGAKASDGNVESTKFRSDDEEDVGALRRPVDAQGRS